MLLCWSTFILRLMPSFSFLSFVKGDAAPCSLCPRQADFWGVRQPGKLLIGFFLCSAMQSVLKHIFNRIYQIIYILKRVSLIYYKLKCSATLLYICGSAPSNQIYRRRLFFECTSLRASSSFLKLWPYLWLFCKKNMQTDSEAAASALLPYWNETAFNQWTLLNALKSFFFENHICFKISPSMC